MPEAFIHISPMANSNNILTHTPTNRNTKATGMKYTLYTFDSQEVICFLYFLGWLQRKRQIITGLSFFMPTN